LTVQKIDKQAKTVKKNCHPTMLFMRKEFPLKTAKNTGKIASTFSAEPKGPILIAFNGKLTKYKQSVAI
jgi:hypothetical protein